MSDITITTNDSTKPIAEAKTLEATVAVGEFRSALLGPKRVILESAGSEPRPEDHAFFSALRTQTRWMAYPMFEEFVGLVFNCLDAENRDKANPMATVVATKAQNATPPLRPVVDADRCFHGPQAYELLRASAEVFVALMCAPGKLFPEAESNQGSAPPKGPSQNVDNPEGKVSSEVRQTEQLRLAGREGGVDWEAIKRYLQPCSFPYLQTIRGAFQDAGLRGVDFPLCEGLLQCCPCPLELIWSYWHEEGMLVQSLNAICLRFQNKRGPHAHDPLANLRLNPLRPLSTLIWGYIQDEHNRLTVARRAYEYDHEYGLRLIGRAVADVQTVDTRSKFLEAFHNLLYATARFYKEADDTTVRADAFPVLNALKELHLILAQGAHNQFGDLPWAARVEMLIQKWLLARPEIREFLGGAPMVPYKESWMPHVDSMKTLQGWTDVSVSHYRDLGVFGEQILLGVRYGDWINIDDPASAYAWAVYWRPEIQSYVHSYRVVTGVNLATEMADTRAMAERFVQPAIHQMRRMAVRQSRQNGSGRRRLMGV